MAITLHREMMEIGTDGDGPRVMAIYTFSVSQEVVTRRKNGMLTVDETTETEPVTLPYIIWRSAECGRVRFRWARRHRGKPEMRMGITTHGARETLDACVRDCIQNHELREKVLDT